VYSDELLLPWAQHALEVAGRPPLFDCHTHVGLDDPAGLLATKDDVLDALGSVRSRGLVFPLKEPTGYREPNRRCIAMAQEHEELSALARIDPADDPAGEAGRLVDAGAVGLKLHPRGEGFALDDERLDDVFALADERRLPIIVHGGVGTPDLGGHALDRCREHPGARLIVAHCATGSWEVLVPEADSVPNLHVDLSWWNPGDLWATLHHVRPSQVLHASDIPFASPVLAAVMTTRMAVQAGLDREQLAAVLGGTTERLVAHDDLVTLERPAPPAEPLAPELERLYVTLVGAVEPMTRGEDGGQGLELARAACSRPAGPHAPLLEAVGELLAKVDEAQPDPRRSLRRPGWDLVLAATIAVRTPAAGVPDLDG
jgi:uncharacterized protein